MRLIYYRNQSGTGLAVRANQTGDYIPFKNLDPSLPNEMNAFLTLGKAGIQKVQNALNTSPDNRDVIVPGDLSTTFLAPVSAPSKILCVGLNYADHAREFRDAIPKEPVFFCKAVSSLNHSGGDILLPETSSRVDYEAELVVVIGKRGRNISPENAMQYVAGYCCGNDVSARDWQKEKPAGQWFLGKSFDTFAPIGPELVTADEIPDPNNLNIELRLNGQVMQSSNTRCFIFPIDTLIAYVSQVMTLEVGDLIFTGTPEGTGDARTPPVHLKKGDQIEVSIESIGVLKNCVV